MAAYDFKVENVKGKENVVADALSRLVANAGEGVVTEEEAFAALDDWLGQPRENETAEVEDPWQEREEEGPGLMEAEERIARTEAGIINDKGNQVWLEYTEGNEVATTASRWGRMRIVKIKVGREATEVELTQVLGELTRNPKTVFVYTQEPRLKELVGRAHAERKISPEGRLVFSTKQVESVITPERQLEVAKEHHHGITNHRGVPGMVEHLKRTWYWPNMKRTCVEVIRTCEVCNRAKYDRHKTDAREEQTETPRKPWELVEIDVFTWEGRKYITFVDRFSKLAGAVEIRRKSAEEVARVMTELCARYGCPRKITSDRGREFRNDRIRGLLREMDIEHHLTTAGHPQSRGTVERFHGTLSEHMRIYKEQGKRGDRETMNRAIVAYNQSVQPGTGYSPVEIMIRGQAVDPPDLEVVRGKLEREKVQRTDRRNRSRGDRTYRDVRVGERIFRRETSRRTKEGPYFTGPWVITEKLPRHRIRIRDLRRQGRSSIIHVTEVRRHPRRR